MPFDQRAPVVLPGGDAAEKRVKTVYPNAGPVWVWQKTHGYRCELVVITVDGTPGGRRIGRPRRTANNAWVAAARAVAPNTGGEQ